MYRTVHPLQNIVLASLPYRELYEICFDYQEEDYEQLRGIIDCRWEVWRDRALGEFDTPYAFFDLPRYFSYLPLPTKNFPGRGAGVARYREVGTYYRLSSFSVANIEELNHPRWVYAKHGKEYRIEGVYEPLAGVYECLMRNDSQGLKYFFPLLNSDMRRDLEERKLRTNEAGILLHELLGKKLEISPEEKRKIELRALIHQTDLPDTLDQNDLKILVEHGNLIAYQRILHILEELYQKDPELVFDEGGIFYAILESGRVDFLQGVLRYYFPFISPDFSIERDIPILPFDPLRKTFPLTEIPFSREMFKYEQLTSFDIDFALSGGNLQVVDFFRSVNRIELFPWENQGGIVIGNNRRRISPEDSFSLIQRTEMDAMSYISCDPLWETGNIDLFLFDLQRCDDLSTIDPWVWGNIIENNQGNLPFIFTLLTYLEEKNPQDWLDIIIQINEKKYPLTYEIVWAVKEGNLGKFTL